MRQRDYSSSVIVTNAKLLVNKLMAQAIGASLIQGVFDIMSRDCVRHIEFVLH